MRSYESYLSYLLLLGHVFDIAANPTIMPYLKYIPSQKAPSHTASTGLADKICLEVRGWLASLRADGKSNANVLEI